MESKNLKKIDTKIKTSQSRPMTNENLWQWKKNSTSQDHQLAPPCGICFQLGENNEIEKK